jgi:hypothetical protein
VEYATIGAGDLVRPTYMRSHRRVFLIYLGPAVGNRIPLSWVMHEDGHVSRITDGDFVPA